MDPQSDGHRNDIRAAWAEGHALVSRAQRLIILSHVSPDGDAFGSMLGLGHALEQQGKQVAYANDGGVPRRYRFLPGSKRVQDKLAGQQAELVIMTDTSDTRRSGEAGKAAFALGLPVINVDHHRTNTLYGTVNIVEGETVAAVETVLHWLDYMQFPLTPEAAQCLLCGLVTDTLCFRTSNVTAETLGVAQRLMAAGGDLATIVQNTLSRTPTSAVRLWGHVMPTIQIAEGVIWVKVSKAAQQASGATDAFDGGLANMLLQADEAYIACVLTEEKETVDVSLRAVPGFDVSGIATSLGGGGHTLAAGAQLPGTDLGAAEATVIPLLWVAARVGTPVYESA